MRTTPTGRETDEDWKEVGNLEPHHTPPGQHDGRPPGIKTAFSNIGARNAPCADTGNHGLIRAGALLKSAQDGTDVIGGSMTAKG